MAFWGFTFVNLYPNVPSGRGGYLESEQTRFGNRKRFNSLGCRSNAYGWSNGGTVGVTASVTGGSGGAGYGGANAGSGASELIQNAANGSSPSAR